MRGTFPVIERDLRRFRRSPALIVMSMVFLEYPETLAPGRTRERIGMKALAGIGRLLRMRTD